MQFFRCNNKIGIVIDGEQLCNPPDSTSKFVFQILSMKDKGELIDVVIIPDGCQHTFMTTATIVMIRDELKALSNKVKYIFI